MQSKRIDKAIRLFGFWSELVGELRSWGGEDFRGSISRIELGIREETTTLDFFVHSFGIVRDWLASKRAANSLGRNPPEVLIHSKPYSVVVN